MNNEEFSSVERAFADSEVPCWRDQLTVRSLVVSFFLSILFSFIVLKLNLTNGIIPSVSVSAGLLGFFIVKTWTHILHKTRFLKVPFTRQENVVIQTCVVASSSITFSGGLGSYLFGMSTRIVNQSGGKYLKDVKEPELLWMIIFLFLVSFTGLFAVVSLRKIMIMELNLTYPSGTATAHLINTFHTPQGGVLARKQVKKLGQCFSASFLWGFFKWFFKGGHGCGFDHFPIFGLQAYHNRFYFDFSTIYIGIGMISPCIVNISMLIGGILSWGIMWPLIEKKRGVWFAADLPSSSMRGLQGYKVFISDSMILGHGIYNFCKVLYTMMIQLRRRKSDKDSDSSSFDHQRRALYFLQDEIPIWLACLGYVCLCTIATVLLPQIFGQLKFYYIIINIMGPILAFCNAYGCGLTDWNLCSTYGKIAIFMVGAWGGANQGVVVCLAACGVMMSLVSTASDLIQNFKICYLTLASPRTIFVSQVVGTAMGCITSALVFKLFYSAFPDLGLQSSEYPAPYATIFFSMATLGVEGFQALPTNCLSLCGVFFTGSILINTIKDYNAEKKWSRWIPVPMAMAIPFFVGSYFAIDMCLGTLILIVWQKLNKAESEMYAPAVASGMICGEGIWSLPSVILALAGIKPPVCMKLTHASTHTHPKTSVSFRIYDSLYWLFVLRVNSSFDYLCLLM